MCFPKNLAEVLRTPIMQDVETSKNKNRSTGLIFCTDEEILRIKNKYGKQ